MYIFVRFQTESVLRNGDMDMQTKDEEVRFLRMEVLK